MFTAKEILDTLDTVVEKRGKDYVYPQYQARADERCEFYDSDEYDALGACHYRWSADDVRLSALLDFPEVVEGQPACIAGAILSELGVLEKYIPDENLTRDEDGSIGPNGTGVTSLLEESGEFDADALLVLDKIQGDQDSGNSWGTCARIAHRWVEAAGIQVLVTPPS